MRGENTPEKESPQPRIELTTTRSWVRHAHHWTTRAGHEQFLKRSPKEQSLKTISKYDQRFQRRRILKNFSEVHTVQKASHDCHVFGRIKILRTILRNYSKFWSAVQRKRFLKNFFKPTQCKMLHPRAAMFFRRIRILRPIFEKGHPRNNPVKLFQNRTCGYRGDFLKNSLKNPFGCHGNQTFRWNQILQTMLKRTTQGIFLLSLV